MMCLELKRISVRALGRDYHVIEELLRAYMAGTLISYAQFLEYRLQRFRVQSDRPAQPEPSPNGEAPRPVTGTTMANDSAVESVVVRPAAAAGADDSPL
jgi:hypothetical protein